MDFIASAIESSGGSIIQRSRPDVAPFEFEARTREGETITLVCYAFTANEYKQSGRPKGEHRFQVKYGSEFDRPHDLLIDQERQVITLFLGVHEEMGLIIAADPAMHNPTWFSSSVEFKEDQLLDAKRKGWHGWIRERVAGGRRRSHPQEDLRSEVLLALKPEHFLTYARFERIATDMDPGERHLLIDRIGDQLSKGHSAADLVKWVEPGTEISKLASHPLLQRLGLDAEELFEVISGRFRLDAAVRGGAAEFHLEKFLKAVPELEVARIDEDGQPDFTVKYRGKSIRIECKNALRNKVKNAPKVDFQRTRAPKGFPCGRYYEQSQFEILAACLHAVSERWEFRFCATRDLLPHPDCPGRLSSNVLVTGGQWTDDVLKVLAQLA